MNLFQSKLKFGPYRIEHASYSPRTTSSNIPRFWDKRRLREVGEQTTRFDFKGPSGAQYEARCRVDTLRVSEIDSLAVSNGNPEGRVILENDFRYRCWLKGKDGSSIRLELDESSKGVARTPHGELVLEGVDDEGVGKAAPSHSVYGFLVYNDDGVRALVDVALARSISLAHKPAGVARDEIAAVCAAMVMLDELYN